MTLPLHLVICGPTAPDLRTRDTSLRPLVRGLRRLGHDVTFLERVSSRTRRTMAPPGCEVLAYDSVDDLRAHHGSVLRRADAVVVAWGVQDGLELGQLVCSEAVGVTALHTDDAPGMLSEIERDVARGPPLRAFDLVLSTTGGRTLDHLERRGARRALPLYATVDADHCVPLQTRRPFALGYLAAPGVPADRVRRLFEDVARRLPGERFIAAGRSGAPRGALPENVVDDRARVSARDHPTFYAQQRMTLTLLPSSVRAAGWSPSGAMLEAAACATTILTEPWDGLAEFFCPGREVLVVDSTEDVLHALRDTSQQRGQAIGEAARRRVFAAHTAELRAAELVSYVVAARRGGSASVARPTTTAAVL